MKITYDYYRILCYIAATQGSFLGAAAVLGGNHPNITKCMNNLEAQQSGRVTNHTTPQVLRALENGAADFDVVTTPTDASACFSQTTLRVFQAQLIAAKEEQKRYPKPLSPQEMIALPLFGLGLA